MGEFTIEGTSERFENTYADVLEEVRLMAEADVDADGPVHSQPRRSLLARLFARQPTARLAA